MIGFKLTTDITRLNRRLTDLIAKAKDLSTPLGATADWLRVDAKRRLFARESDDVTGGLWRSLDVRAFPDHAEVFSPLPYARIQNEGGRVYPKGKALAQPVRKQERRNHIWPRNFPGKLWFLPVKGRFPIVGYLMGYPTNTRTYATQRYRQAKATAAGRKRPKIKSVLLYILRKWTTIPSKPGNRWGPYIAWSDEARAFLRQRLSAWFGLSNRRD